MSSSSLSRRDVFRLFAAATAAGAALPREAVAQAPLPLTRFTKDHLTDPDFNNKVIPWDKPLTEAELATLTILCDLIIPGDDLAPPPSKIGVADFLNEWVGAPYQEMINDSETIRGGLAWLHTHSHSLHQKRFDDLSPAQQTAILDSICGTAEKPSPALAPGIRFFRRLRTLTIGGYYSHSSTWKSLGYVGNVAIGGPYPGVPDEVIDLLGVRDML